MLKRNLTTKAAVNTRETESKIPDITAFITIPEFNRLVNRLDFARRRSPNRLDFDRRRERMYF